ncbi:MAG: MauE/DoxX family redox-associated membrane protein, partial [Mycobacteriales bacterium]
MDVVAAPYLAAALLLVVAGVAKALDPLSLVRALRATGLTVRAPLLARWVRAFAVVEAAVGAAAVVVPGRAVAIAVALSYAGFTAFVLRALRSGSSLASCGCFGPNDTPPTRTHAAVTAVLSLLTLAAATDPGVSYGAALFFVTGVLAYLTYLVLAVLP